MKIVQKIASILLGAIMLIFGLNKFFQFIPMPELSGNPATFFNGMVASGYLLPLIAITEIVAGVFILLNRYKNLGLVILFPVTINILLYHSVTDPSGMPMAIAVFAMNFYLLWVNKSDFNGVLKS